MVVESALVTGGAGFIGSHISEMLLREGVRVTVIDDLSVGVRENIPAGVKFVQGDIRDLELMRRLAMENQVIFHQAARVSIRASVDGAWDDADVNLMGTLTLLRACAGSAVKKIVFASSMAVYSDSFEKAPVAEDAPAEPASPYGIAKLAAEKYCLMMCRQHGIDCVVLRYFNTFGRRQTYTPYVGVITIFINRLLAGERPVIFGDGEQLRDFVHVEDVARANILALKSEVSGAIVNVGSGEATSVMKIAELLRARINPGIEFDHGDERSEELKISYADISRARASLGFSPRWKLEDKIDDVIDFIRCQAKIDQGAGD